MVKAKFIPNIFGTILITAFFIFIAALLYSLPVWLIWNYLMPRIFGLPRLSILDAFLLNVLAGILFSKEKKND
jgi:hypothetical protein